jgi:hypothetical protein
MYNKIFSGYQPWQNVEWQKKPMFRGPSPSLKRWFFAIQPFDAAGSPRRFYYIRLQMLIQKISIQNL